MSCFFFYFKPMGLYSGVYAWLDVYVSDRGGLIRGWAYTRVGLSVAVYGTDSKFRSLPKNRQ